MFDNQIMVYILPLAIILLIGIDIGYIKYKDTVYKKCWNKLEIL